ncbi:MAG TPA: DUF559 domain-containing protein [Rhodospirillales bacterium]|nr:DUF559 domain-containing protein [Rhodospirillales bacterium]
MSQAHKSQTADVHTLGEVNPSQADPAVLEAVLSMLAEAPAGARLDELVRSPALVRLGAGPSEVMRALAGLHAARLVRLGPLRRWRLTDAADGSDTGRVGPGGKALVAVPADVRRAPTSSPDPAVAGGTVEIDGWAFAARYLAHAACVLAEEERARTDIFADRAGELVQPLLPRAPWWPETGERVVLRIERERLADPFQGALARRAEDEVAIVWGLRVREPRGSDVGVWTPLVVWPALWRPEGDHIEIEFTTPLPTVDTSALRVRGREERRRIAEWLGLLVDEEEQALATVDPPELGRRLGPLLGGKLREPLDPLRVRRTMPLSAGEGIYDLFALVLLDRTRYGGGAVRELRDLAAAVERGEFRETALATLFADVAAAEGDGWLFEPLELSGSQLDAARDASVQPLTVITGPPGTGKSQVVAAIAATAALSGRTVLISSRNHRAIDAVEERLRDLGPGWFLRLSSPDGAPAPDWQQLCQYVLAQAEHPREEREAGRLREHLAELDAERRVLVDELDRWFELADCYAATEDAVERLGAFGIDDSKQLLERAWRLLKPSWLQRIGEQLPLIGPRLRARREARMSDLLGRKAPGDAPPEEHLQRIIRLAEEALGRNELAAQLRGLRSREGIERRLVELAAEIRGAARRALAPGPRPRLDEAAREGLRALLDELQLAEATGDTKRMRKAWHAHGRHLLARVPVVAVTNLSAASRLPLTPGLFDLLIVDEASQCDIPSALPLFARVKRAVVVGDPMQLRHVSRVTPAREVELLRQQGLSLEAMGGWLASLRSLFDAAERRAQRRHFLAEHYRSHPDIASYVSRTFYDGRLHPLTSSGALRPPRGLRPGIHWQHVEGEIRAARSGCFAPTETAAVVEHIARLLDAGFEGTIGVTTPFREQARRLSDAIAARFPAEALDRHQLVASSIHQFQGDARDVMLVSLCLGRGTPRGSLEFLRREARLLNVAVSRARVVCLVFGDRDAARHSGIGHIIRLLDHAERRGGSGDRQREPFQSPWEKRLYEALRARGLVTVPQFPIAGRFLDLAVPEVRLDIEVDGDHHRGPDGRHRIEDRWRDIQLRAIGWEVSRFWVYELREDLDGCVERILARVRKLAART